MTFQRVFEAAIALAPQLQARNTSVIYAWLNEGCDPEYDIIPVLERLIAKNPEVGGFQYFTKAIMRARDERLRAESIMNGTNQQAIADDAVKAKNIALALRKYGVCVPHDQRWLADYEAQHGEIRV